MSVSIALEKRLNQKIKGLGKSALFEPSVYTKVDKTEQQWIVHVSVASGSINPILHQNHKKTITFVMIKVIHTLFFLFLFFVKMKENSS